MPVEIKETQSTKEERELGMKLLDKYQHESFTLLRDYLEQERPLRTLPHAEYMKKRAPLWKKYQEEDENLHEVFLENVETLGYKLKAI